MTADPSLAVLTTHMEASSAGLLWFRANTEQEELSQLDAQTASAAQTQLSLQRFELFRISTTWFFSIEHRYGIDKHANSQLHTQHPVCSIQLSVARQPAKHPISRSLSAGSDRKQLHHALEPVCNNIFRSQRLHRAVEGVCKKPPKMRSRWLLALLPLALSLQPPVLKARLEAQETRIRELRKRCEDVLPSEDEAALLLDGYYPALDRDEALDHFLLRFVDGVRDGIDLADAESTLRDSLEWRRGVGRIVLEKAQEAVNEASNATADASASTTARQKGRWKNAPVQRNLPHKFAVGEFLTDEQLTYVLDGQRARLVCCIQGRRIDEDGLMQALEAQSSPDDHAMRCVDVEEAVDTLAMRRLQHSFLYSKAVNARVCALLSLKTGVLVTVVTVNDLKDVSLRSTKLAGQFRAALGGAARRGDRLFPTLAGPTVIANLPKAIQLLVGLVANLFPVSVRRFLTFARIDSLDDGLRRLLVEPDASAAFLDDVDGTIDKMLRRLPPNAKQ